MKKQILLSTIAASTLAATIVPTITSCSCTKGYSQMEVEELAKSKEIEGDSDKETIQYQFKQKVTSNYKSTKASLVDFKVHDTDEQFIESLLKTENLEDGTVNVYFNTQYFVAHYLTKYYDPNNNTNVIPSTYKFRLVNDDDQTAFTSAEYKLSITPAEYRVPTLSYSSNLTLPEEKTLKVLQEYSAKYTLADDCIITNRSILRFDGVELYGKDDVIFDQGQILIPSDYVTGPILISASAELTKCYVFGIGGHVEYSDLREYVKPGEKITGKYTIKDGKEFDPESSGVCVDGKWLQDGYSIKNGEISVEASKVTGNVYIYVAVKDIVKYSVSAVSSVQGAVSFNVPSEVLPKTEITGTYSINDQYEFDKSTTYVSINGVKLTTGFSIDNGKILINATMVTGNVVIFVGVKEAAKVLVTAVGDPYVEFAHPSRAIVGKDYKLTYKTHYGSLKDISVKNNKGALAKEDYSYKNGVLTIKGSAITKDGGDITITATGNPTAFSFTPDFDDRIYVVSKTSPINYMVDFKCTIGLYMEAGTVTGWGCSVGGDESYTQYLEYNSETKTFTLPGKYVKGNIKIWASLA